MKIRMLCIVAHPNDTRFAPINDVGNTVMLRGLDLKPDGKVPLGGFKVGEVYDVELSIKPV